MYARPLAAFVVAVVALAGADRLVAAPAAGAASTAKAAAPENAVDINKATAADLTKVPGIGPSLAKRIVDFRDKNGAFTKVEDLVKVQGIGEKSLQRFAPYLTISKNK